MIWGESNKHANKIIQRGQRHSRYVPRAFVTCDVTQRQVVPPPCPRKMVKEKEKKQQKKYRDVSEVRTVFMLVLVLLLCISDPYLARLSSTGLISS